MSTAGKAINLRTRCLRPMEWGSKWKQAILERNQRKVDKNYHTRQLIRKKEKEKREDQRAHPGDISIRPLPRRKPRCRSEQVWALKLNEYDLKLSNTFVNNTGNISQEACLSGERNETKLKQYCKYHSQTTSLILWLQNDIYLGDKYQKSMYGGGTTSG